MTVEAELLVVAVVVVGTAFGVVAGLGGAVLIVPGLLLAGFQPVSAASVGLLATAAASTAAAPRQLTARLANHRLAVVAELGAVAGAVLGALLASRLTGVPPLALTFDLRGSAGIRWLRHVGAAFKHRDTKWEDQMDAEILHRPLGRTGLRVAEVGLGAWALGGVRYGAVPRRDAADAIHAYADTGGNLIDTAPGYGHSEEIIGSVLPSLPDEMLVVSKSPNTGMRSHHLHIRDDLTASLTRLGRDHIDVYLMHDPPAEAGVRDAALEELQRLRDQGKIRHLGASIDGPSVTDQTVSMCDQYVDTGVIDVVEIIISPLRQLLVHAGVVDRCELAGVGVLARTALESGFLSGRYPATHEFAVNDHRSRWSQDSRVRIDGALVELRGICSDTVGSPDSLIEVGARFPLAYRGVSSVLMGARSAEQVHANVSAAALGALPQALQKRLETWGRDRTTGFNPDPL